MPRSAMRIRISVCFAYYIGSGTKVVGSGAKPGCDGGMRRYVRASICPFGLDAEGLSSRRGAAAATSFSVGRREPDFVRGQELAVAPSTDPDRGDRGRLHRQVKKGN